MSNLISKTIVFLSSAIIMTGCNYLINAMSAPMVPEDYQRTVKTGGIIEKKYLTDGEHSVKYFEQNTDEVFKKYEVWYPETMETGNDLYPLIVMLNGTGVAASRYKEQFKHFASWGFIVIGTEEKESWDAVAAEKSLAFMLAENENPSSVFYHKIDVGNVGAMGHSQGGVGVINAITERANSSIYKAAIALSPTNEKQTVSLKWHYDLSKIAIPIFIAAGTKGSFEMKMVLPTEDMHEMYNKITAPKAMARKLDCEHGDMLYSTDGYTTAWFMWHLQGDSKAAAAFVGDNPELLDNTIYTEQSISDALRP